MDEAEAILDYTNSIDATNDTGLIAAFEEIRNDELTHVQKLTYCLTLILCGKQITMADGEGEDDEQYDNIE